MSTREEAIEWMAQGHKAKHASWQRGTWLCRTELSDPGPPRYRDEVGVVYREEDDTIFVAKRFAQNWILLGEKKVLREEVQALKAQLENLSVRPALADPTVNYRLGLHDRVRLLGQEAEGAVVELLAQPLYRIRWDDNRIPQAILYREADLERVPASLRWVGCTAGKARFMHAEGKAVKWDDWRGYLLRSEPQGSVDVRWQWCEQLLNAPNDGAGWWYAEVPAQ